jgi:phosphoglycerate dehydrogenase-like enzyme
MGQAKKNNFLNIRVYTAGDSPSVFRIDEGKIDAAISRHPDLAEKIRFSLTRTQGGYGRNPGWSDEDIKRFREEMSDADVFVGYMFPIENLSQTAPHLKWIHIIGAGVEHLSPFSWLPKDITLTNNRGAHAPKTCEYAMMAMLMLGNHIPRLTTAQKKGYWDGHFVSTIEGGVAVVVGAGKQGASVAKGAKRLGLYTIGIDLDNKARENFDQVVLPQDMHEVLSLADFVGITLPLTPETDKFFGEKEFEALKPGVGLFNISRGRILDTDKLLENLYSGKLSGAILDVFEIEPLPSDSPLWNAPNLIITPHMGCDDEKNYIDRTFDIVLDNALRLLNGITLENIVDPNRGY